MKAREPDHKSPTERPVIEFRDYEGTYSAVGVNGRLWRITRASTGFRLEFRDPGDVTATYAGTHATVARAQMEAAR